MTYLKVISTTFFLLLLTQLGTAQNVKVDLRWEGKDSVFFIGKLHRIKCKVSSAIGQKMRLIVKPEKPLRLLSPATYKINIKNEESYNASVKIYFPNEIINDRDSLQCAFIVESLEDGKVLAKTIVRLEIKERVFIRMEAVKKQLPIKSTDSIAVFPVRINNFGNKKYKVEVGLKTLPKGLKFQKTKLGITLREKSDTLIKFLAIPEQGWEKVNVADLEFALNTLADGKEVANCNIKAFPLGAFKKYSTTGKGINNLHEFMVAFQARGKNTKVVNVKTKGITPFRQGLLSYQFQSAYAKGESNLEIFNSVVRYYKNFKSLKIGDVTYQDEVSISGKGVHFEIDRDSTYAHIGYINATTELFGPIWPARGNAGNSLTGGYRKKVSEFESISGNGVLRVANEGASGLMWFSNTYDSEFKRRELFLGISTRQSKLEPEHKGYQTGISARANFERRFKSWGFYSRNTYTTTNYSGLGAGLRMISGNINFVAWEFVKPKFIFRSQQVKSQFSEGDINLNQLYNFHNFQLQLETAKSKRFRLILSTSRIFQKRNNVDPARRNQFLSGESTIVRTTLIYQKSGLSVNTYGEAARFQYGFEGLERDEILSYQVGLSLKLDHIDVKSSYQYGSNSILDVYPPDRFQNLPANFSLSLGWRKHVFDKKIKLAVIKQLIHNNIRELWMSTSVLSLKSKQFKGMVFSSEYNLSVYRSFILHDFNLKFTKKIGNYKSPASAKKVKISLFADENNNGIKEPDERTIPNILVQIDGIPFVSNEAGFIVYKKLPLGKYKIIAIDPSGNLATGQRTVTVNGKMNISIPMYKTGLLKGRVVEIKERFKNAKFELQALPVVAKNKEGETFTTYTQADGSYTLNLPENEYTVYLDPKAFDSNFKLPDNFQTVKVSQSEEVEVTLSVKVKQREMKIQRF